MISAVDELESAVRCIELGAMDYLPKPFNASLLYARLGASLAEKRLRDLEREYLEQVTRVTDAAASVESGSFEISGCDSVALRGDALGTWRECSSAWCGRCGRAKSDFRSRCANCK